jgi:hypothetical protein
MFKEKPFTVAVCEHCGMEGPMDANGAKQAGWKIVGEDYYCPEHTNSPLTGPVAVQEFAQRLKRFVLEQERNIAYPL